MIDSGATPLLILVNNKNKQLYDIGYNCNYSSPFELAKPWPQYISPKMASSASQAHPTYSTRPYQSSLHGGGKIPDRSTALGFGVSSQSHGIRETGRLERERQERERQERAAAAQKQQLEQQAVPNIGSMAQITDEQRDEINEAVSPK